MLTKEEQEAYLATVASWVGQAFAEGLIPAFLLAYPEAGSKAEAAYFTLQNVDTRKALPRDLVLIARQLAGGEQPLPLDLTEKRYLPSEN